MIWLDFETRSRCDLRSAGLYNYVQDLSTDVLCMSYAFNDGEVQTWLPGLPLPDLTGHRIMAHNAAFERLVLWYVLQVNIPLEQFYCTATQARANCAPGSLEDVGRFMGASMKKDHRGAALIRKMSIPPFEESAELTAEMVSYCEQDVRAMRAISKAMRPLSDEELGDYHVNERINDLGVLVDVPLCHAAVRYADAEALEIAQIVKEVSKGALTSVRSPKMRQWVWDRVGPEARALMTKDDKVSIDKTVRANLLNCDEVPPMCKRSSSVLMTCGPHQSPSLAAWPTLPTKKTGASEARLFLLGARPQVGRLATARKFTTLPASVPKPRKPHAMQWCLARPSCLSLARGLLTCCERCYGRH